MVRPVWVRCSNAVYRTQLFGVTGSAEMTTGFPDSFTMLKLDDGSDIPAFDEGLPLTSGKQCYGNSHVRALAAFTQCVQTATPYPIGPEEARRAVDVILALYRSQRTQRTVRLT